MATLTIRGLPDELHAVLKERARENRRSLNQEVIDRLAATEESHGTGEMERRRRAGERMERVIGEIEELRRGMTRFMTAEEIDAAIEEGRA